MAAGVVTPPPHPPTNTQQHPPGGPLGRRGKHHRLHDSPFSDYFSNEARSSRGGDGDDDDGDGDDSMDSPSSSAAAAALGPDAQRLLVRLAALQAQIMRDGGREHHTLRVVERKMAELDRELGAVQAQTRMPAEMEDSGLFMGDDDDNEEEEDDADRKHGRETERHKYRGPDPDFLLLEARRGLACITRAQTRLRQCHRELRETHDAYHSALEERVARIDRLRARNVQLANELALAHADVHSLQAPFQALESEITALNEEADDGGSDAMSFPECRGYSPRYRRGRVVQRMDRWRSAYLDVAERMRQRQTADASQLPFRSKPREIFQGPVEGNDNYEAEAPLGNSQDLVDDKSEAELTHESDDEGEDTVLENAVLAETDDGHNEEQSPEGLGIVAEDRALLTPQDLTGASDEPDLPLRDESEADSPRTQVSVPPSDLFDDDLTPLVDAAAEEIDPQLDDTAAGAEAEDRQVDGPERDLDGTGFEPDGDSNSHGDGIDESVESLEDVEDDVDTGILENTKELVDLDQKPVVTDEDDYAITTSSELDSDDESKGANIDDQSEEVNVDDDQITPMPIADEREEAFPPVARPASKTAWQDLWEGLTHFAGLSEDRFD